MTISTIENATEKSTKPATRRMTSQRFHKRSRRRHSARASFIGVQLTAAMKRGLRGERNGSRSTKRLRQPREHHKVGVKRDTLQTAHAERRKSVLVLQASELALHGGTDTVKAAPS